MDFNVSASRLNGCMQLTASKNAMGYKDPITLASKTEGGDLHAWVETSKGDILDYSNNHPYYQIVRNLNGFMDERVYHAFSPNEAPVAWKEVFNTHVRPNRISIQLRLKSKDAMYQLLAQFDQTGRHCVLCAYLVF